jgi:hypothetical protein
MLILALVLSELLVLLLLSHRLTNALFALFYLLFRSQTVAVGLITFLSLPGTVIHEFAHLIVAEVLRVSTGEISFSPEIIKTAKGTLEVKMGHVQVAESDPIRRYLIGFAPVFFGMFFLLLTIWIFSYFSPQITNMSLLVSLYLGIGYLLFSISNNMFSSSKDLEGFIIFGPILAIIIAAAYFAGLRFTLTGGALAFFNHVLTTLSHGLAVVIGVNVAIFILNWLLLILLGKMIGRNVGI